jgi:hypothetical protein
MVYCVAAAVLPDLGAFKRRGAVVHELFRPLSEHLTSRVYIGTLVNTCTARDGEVSRVAPRPAEG